MGIQLNEGKRKKQEGYLVNKYKNIKGNSKPKSPKKDHPWKTGILLIHKLKRISL